MATDRPGLDVELSHRVHPGLTIAVRFRVEAGCAVIAGASGAGKTTILRLIAGLVRPDRGRISLDGRLLCEPASGLHAPIRSRGIGFIFQDDLLFPHRSVAGNVGFGLDRWDRAEARRRLREVSELCGVTHLLDRRPATLSGGERQRVGLARAIAPRPRLLLCDEPVSALDVPSRAAILERLSAVGRAERVPILLVTHSPAEAVSTGDWLYWLDAGRIAAEGPPLDVLSRRSPIGLDDLYNRFEADVAEHEPGYTRLRLVGGPDLIVPRCDRPVGARVSLIVRAEDLLLARGDLEAAVLSARNVLPGEVERVVSRGAEAEVVLRTGGVRWIASVVAPAVDALSLQPGAVSFIIIKARSCHVLAGGLDPPLGPSARPAGPRLSG